MHYIKNFINTQFFDKNNQIIGKKMKKEWFEKHDYIKQYELIISKTNFITSSSFSERIYCIINDIHMKVLCKNKKCNNPVRFLCYSYGYSNYCCSKCSSSDIETRNKYKKTCLKKYGFENATKSQFVKNKRKKTCLERYGVENVNQLEFIKNKKIKTCLEKHGVKNIAQVQSTKNKYKETCLEKYGAENVAQAQSTKDKYKETCLERYGVENATQKHIKYIKKLQDKLWLIKNHHDLKKSCSQIAVELGITPAAVIRYMNLFDIKIKHYYSSISEKEVCSFLKNKNIIRNCRNIIHPHELDIYIPEHKLAIEFNGNYWHSKYCENYHLNKTELCKKKDIQLFHIFENEWLNPSKNKIWKNIINNKLKNIKIIISGVSEISKENANIFIESFSLKNIKLSENIFALFSKKNIFAIISIENKIINIYSKNGCNLNIDILFEYFNCNKLFVNLNRRFEIIDNYFKLKDYKVIKKIKPSLINDSKYKVYDCGNIIYEITL